MRSFFRRCRLDYINMRYIFYLPLLVTMVFAPFIVWTTMIRAWQPGEALLALKRAIEFIEILVPMPTIFWSVAIFDKYFRTGVKESMLIHSVNKSCVSQVIANLLLHGVASGFLYWVLYKFYPVAENVMGEWTKGMAQVFFLNALAYAATFVFRHNIYGFMVSFLYYMSYRFLGLTGFWAKFTVFCGGNLYGVDFGPQKVIRTGFTYGLVLLAIGYAANRIYTRKRGNLQTLIAKIKGVR